MFHFRFRIFFSFEKGIYHSHYHNFAYQISVHHCIKFRSLSLSVEFDCLKFSYEKSDTQRFEVPRMLFDDPKVLEAYVKKRRDQ